MRFRRLSQDLPLEGCGAEAACSFDRRTQGAPERAFHVTRQRNLIRGGCRAILLPIKGRLCCRTIQVARLEA